MTIDINGLFPVNLATGADNCKNCAVPDDPRYYDIESEEYFTCSDCACFRCAHKHNCIGQCAQPIDNNGGYVYNNNI